VVRLQKYLAECGVASRRASETLIAEGRVSINGVTATLGQSVDPATDRVAVDGRELGTDEKVYIVLNKPRNVVTTARDTHGRRTVLDCVHSNDARVFPVGRLDFDVEGVLLLTNDGELAFRLIHPKFEIEKEYLAWVRGKMEPAAAARLEAGVELEDGPTAPAKVSVLETRSGNSLVRLIIHEGRKREVKRMCAAVGHPVQTLRRITFAGIEVNGMRPGEWRNLTEREVAGLKKIVGLH
jgi:pseudouridine synthase